MINPKAKILFFSLLFLFNLLLFSTRNSLIFQVPWIQRSIDSSNNAIFDAPSYIQKKNHWDLNWDIHKSCGYQKPSNYPTKSLNCWLMVY